MALRDILTKEDPLLRKRSREVAEFGKRTSDLIDDLLETVESAEGYGLAAPQIGTLRRVVVVFDGKEKFIPLVNPVITEKSGSVTGTEACLSCPGEYGTVTRPQKVTVRAFDRNGTEFEMTCEDMTARCVCHEIDHLDGKLYIDIAEKVYEGDMQPAEDDSETGEQGG